MLQKALLKVRARLTVRVPAVPKQAVGIGALWIGLAGSNVANKVFKARYLVCPAHRRRPRLEHLDIMAGRWTVDAQVCCKAFLTTVRNRLASTKATRPWEKSRQAHPDKAKPSPKKPTRRQPRPQPLLPIPRRTRHTA